MKRKKIGIIVSILVVGILTTTGIFSSYKYIQKEKEYSILLANADKDLEEHNFKDAKSQYEEALQIKDNIEVKNKLSLIKDTEESLEQLQNIQPLLHENKFDEATELLNKIASPSEYISNEIKNKTSEIFRLKEDFIEQEKKAKEEERRLAEEKRKEDEKRIAEEKKKEEEKRRTEELKKVEEKNKQTPNKNNSQNNNISSNKNYNVRTKIIFDAQSPVYITYDQTVNIVAKDYFKKNPNVNVRDPNFYLSAIEGSFIVNVELNGKILEYEINPTNGNIIGINQVKEIPQFID